MIWLRHELRLTAHINRAIQIMEHSEKSRGIASIHDA